ncbi:UNVERIFIED_ORG: hypothetical protein EDC92_12449 [Dietzia maris]|uniref:hypothetical protein n=1 Tax=Dietzia maris TaxID=37915 RepID=UPI0010471550
MSVTFFPEEAPVVGYRVADFAGGRAPELFGDRAEAVAAVRDAEAEGRVLPGCTDPEDTAGMGGYFVEALTTDLDQAPRINISSINAVGVLELLGYAHDGEVDLCGSCGAEEFEGRVLTALALAPADAGVPAYETAGAGGATVLECGRRPGYHQDILGRLHELATWSRDRQRTVCWS